jgi:hypothetical protein
MTTPEQVVSEILTAGAIMRLPAPWAKIIDGTIWLRFASLPDLESWAEALNAEVAETVQRAESPSVVSAFFDGQFFGVRVVASIGARPSVVAGPVVRHLKAVTA